MGAPVVSVIVVTHNHERFIERALDGVLGQQLNAPVEILVAEDASSDRTREIVTAYAAAHPQRLRLLLSERNLGCTAVTLRAIAAARGEYLAIMDGDDLWTAPDKLDRQLRCLEADPARSVCFHDMSIIDGDGRTIDPRFVHAGAHPETGLSELLAGNYIPGSAPMFRRTSVVPLPPWIEHAPYADWALLIAAARHGRIAYIPEVMGAYRRHSGGMWSGLDEAQQIATVVGAYDHLEPHIWPEWRDTLRQARAGWRVNLVNALDRLGRRDDADAALADGARHGDVARARLRPPADVDLASLRGGDLIVRAVQMETSVPTAANGGDGYIDEVCWTADGRQVTAMGWGRFLQTSPPPSLVVESSQAVEDAAAVRLPRPDVAQLVDASLDRSGFWLRVVSAAPFTGPIRLRGIDSGGASHEIGAIAPPGVTTGSSAHNSSSGQTSPSSTS